MEIVSQAARYLFALMLLIPMYSIALVVRCFSEEMSWRIIRQWNLMFLAIFDVEVAIEYETPWTGPDLSDGGVMVGLNQQSLLDPTIGYAAITRVYKSFWNIEYAMIPLVGWIAWIFGWVVIRQWPRQAKAQIKKAVTCVRNGGLVFLSIEGKRSKDRLLGQFKRGPAVLAIEAQANIFPLFMKGSSNCLPYGEWKIRPGTVVIKVLNPISTKGMSYENRGELVHRLRNLAETQIRDSAQSARSGHSS